MPTSNRKAPVYYPSSEIYQVAETDVHIAQLIDLHYMLRVFFRSDPSIYVAFKTPILFAIGGDDEPSAITPDLFVVKGIAPENHSIYTIWEESPAPAVVFEFATHHMQSESAIYHSDYAGLGVREYFIFDPLGQYLKPPLRGYRLSGGEYELLRGEPLLSAELGLELHIVAGHLRLYDPQRKEYLLSPDETQARAERAEAEVARLRAELERLRGRASP